MVNWADGAPQQLQTGGNHADNAAFTFSNGLWTPDTPLYWKDQKTKADFYCYYPYDSTVGDVSSYAFAVSSDQSTEEGYKASDFLWGAAKGVSPTPDPVQITTNHVMSCLLIHLEPGNGYTEESLAAADRSVRIGGVLLQSEIDLSDGTAMPVGEAGEITPLEESPCSYKALAVPQTLTDVPLVQLNIDGNEYTLTQSLELSANTRHSCTVTVNKTSEGVNIGIGDWENDGTDYGGTVE